MRTVAFATLALLAAPLFACGGADSSDLFGGPNPTGNDAGVGNEGGSCDPSRCALAAPGGFRLVTYATDRSKSCLAGWTSSDVVSNPVATTSTCSCTCNVTTQPDCSKGSINRFIDSTNSGSCSTAGTTFMATGGCDQIAGTLYLQSWRYQADPPPSTGGACNFSATVDKTKLTANGSRVCTPPSACPGAICDAANICVAQDGDVACPSSFPTKTLVGTAANADCGSCGSTCAVSADCTGTLSLYEDSGCTTGKEDFPVDSTCNAPPTFTGSYVAYKYAGSVKGTPNCGKVPPPPQATPKVDKPTTVCCKKA